MNRLSLAVMAVAGVAASAVPLAVRPTPALVWNTTTSAPIGLYRVLPEARPTAGDWVFARPPASLAQHLATAGFLPLGALLLKRIVAVAPSVVCRTGVAVAVDGRPAALALVRDRFGRPLPAWSGCARLQADEVFLLNPDPRSFDSRYFGALPAHLIVGRAAPLLLQGGGVVAR